MASKEALEALDPARYALSGKAREDALGTLSDLEYNLDSSILYSEVYLMNGTRHLA